MVCPAMVMSPVWRIPSTRSFMRLKLRRSVDLPQPDGPMKAVTCFSGISSEMSKSVWWDPYQKLYFRTDRYPWPASNGLVGVDIMAAGEVFTALVLCGGVAMAVMV